MKAVGYKVGGSPDTLKIIEMNDPVPKANEVLIKIHAASVTAGDIHLRKFSSLFWLIFKIFGLKKKINLGNEYAGEIIEIGADVSLYKKGDFVYGTTTGLKEGSYAEYICIPEKDSQGGLSSRAMGLMPKNIDFKTAATVPVGGMAACDLLKKANITQGTKILIYGASGSVGTYALQLAINLGAVVTGVCGTSNITLVQSLGAVHVIDYTKNDLYSILEKFDVVFDAVGKISKSKCKSIMKPNGKYITVKSPTSEKKEYLDNLKRLIEEGKVKPIIDRIYPMEKISEAHTYVEKGHKKGNVVIEINK